MRIALFIREPLYREALISLLASRGYQVVGAVQEGGADVALVDAGALGPSELATLAVGLPIVLLVSGNEHKDAPVSRRVSPSEGSGALFEALGSLRGGAVRERRAAYGGLTPREREVAGLVARGMSNRTISQTLDMREQSVKNLVSTIMRKLGCDNRVQVALRLRNEAAAADNR